MNTQILTLLIQDDIKQTRLVHTLRRLDIDAMSQLPNASGVVLELLGMEMKQENDHLLRAYFKKITDASNDEKTKESDHITNIINWLETVTIEK